MAEELLHRSGIAYRKIVVKDDETAELAQRYNVRSVPVLISGKNRYTGINEINDFVR
jgi:glutaredoxin